MVIIIEFIVIHNYYPFMLFSNSLQLTHHFYPNFKQLQRNYSEAKFLNDVFVALSVIPYDSLHQNLLPNNLIFKHMRINTVFIYTTLVLILNIIPNVRINLHKIH